MRFDVLTMELLSGPITRIMCTTVGLFDGDKQTELMDKLAVYPFAPSVQNFLHFGESQTVIYLMFNLAEDDVRIEGIKDIIKNITRLKDYEEN